MGFCSLGTRGHCSCINSKLSKLQRSYFVPDTKLLSHLNPSAPQEYLKCMLTTQQFYDVVNHTRQICLSNAFREAVECDRKPCLPLHFKFKSGRPRKLKSIIRGRFFESPMTVS